MLLLLKYGHKQSKSFNIDCILGNLLDAAKQEAVAETVRTLKEAGARWHTTLSELDEKITQTSARMATKRDGDNERCYFGQHIASTCQKRGERDPKANRKGERDRNFEEQPRKLGMPGKQLSREDRQYREAAERNRSLS